MQIVFDYLSGKIGSDEFKAAWHQDPEIGLWIEHLIDLQSPPKAEWASAPYPHYRMAIHRHYNGSFLRFIEASEKAELKAKRRPKWLDIGWRFQPIAAIVCAAYPQTKLTKYYDEERDFHISVRAEYTGGSEVEAFIDDLLAQFPRSLGKTNRKREAKSALRKLFHIEGGKYPRWVQEPEWPRGVKGPMVFIGQKRKGEVVEYTFKDADTNETRILEQLY